MQKCLVGRLVKNNPTATSDDFEKAFFENIKCTEEEKEEKFKKEKKNDEFEAGCSEDSFFESDIKMCWCQTTQCIKFIFQCKISSPQILVKLKPEQHLRILMRVKKKLHLYCFKLERKVLWPCVVNVNTDTGKVELEFEKKEEGIWNTYGENDKNHGMMMTRVDEIEEYHKAKIININQITHNVRTFVFKFVDKVLMWVPIGHDVRIRGIIEGIDYAKQYTPIPPYLPHGEPTLRHWHHDYMCFMVKYYSEGALTPYLFGKKEQDVVEIGGMSGNFNIRKLNNVKKLYLIAAGSGLSPMLKIIVWAISKKDQM